MMTIQALRDAAPGQTIWDRGDRGSVNGLHIRVSPSGKKTFLLYYRSKAGTQRRPKIGVFGEITLAEARKRARKIMDRVSVGEDPKADWDKAKAEPTVRDVFNQLLQEYWSKARFVESRRLTNISCNWKNHVERVFGHRKLSEVDSLSIRKWHGSLQHKPYAANRSLGLLSQLFNFAEYHGMLPPGSNPCRHVKPYTEQSRNRFASAEELGKLAPLLDAASEMNPQAVAFLYLLMFSGSRPRAIERATWDQLQKFENNGEPFGVLTFSGKSSESTGEQETVVIPPQAMKIIDKLPRIEGGTITGVKMPRKLWARIRKEAGCPDLWARDFRRTFATIGLSSGVNIGTISELLNHQSTQTTKIYAKLMRDARVDAALDIASKIDAILEVGRNKV